MKKILFATSLMAVVGTSAAATGGTLNSGANDVSTSACTLLASAVKITLSNGNVGGYDCSATSANIGVAVASTTGKNKIFSIGSSGGALSTTTTASAPDAAGCQTQAEAVSASS